MSISNSDSEPDICVSGETRHTTKYWLAIACQENIDALLDINQYSQAWFGTLVIPPKTMISIIKIAY